MSKQAFLSHSSKDVDFARTLVEQLEARAEQSEELDLTIFFAPRDLSGGKHYGEGLTSAIIKSDVVLLIMSQYSIGAVGSRAVGSDDVLAEIQTAHDHRKRLIPLFTGDTRRLTCHIRFQHLLSAHQDVDIQGCVETGHYDRACEMILAAISGSTAAPGAKERNALYEIEACLKKGSHAIARRALAVAGGSPQDAERAELLKIIGQLQHTPVHKLNKSTADALVERLNRLLGGSETPAVLYVLGALSVHFYTRFFMADTTGGMSELKAQARALPFAAAKYVIMMRHTLPKDSRFELDWRL